jgi:hypothetical protein
MGQADKVPGWDTCRGDEVALPDSANLLKNTEYQVIHDYARDSRYLNRFCRAQPFSGPATDRAAA